MASVKNARCNQRTLQNGSMPSLRPVPIIILVAKITHQFSLSHRNQILFYSLNLCTNETHLSLTHQLTEVGHGCPRRLTLCKVSFVSAKQVNSSGCIPGECSTYLKRQLNHPSTLLCRPCMLPVTCFMRRWNVTGAFCSLKGMPWYE